MNYIHLGITEGKSKHLVPSCMPECQEIVKLTVTAELQNDRKNHQI